MTVSSKRKNELPPIKFTPREQEQLDRCYAILEDEQAVQCEEEALQIAMRESYQEDAAELMVTTLVRAIVRSVRAGTGQLS